MKAIRCFEAVNLDGGSSKALAVRNDIVVPPGRPLTNVIVVYDRKNPAPEALKQSWEKFQAEVLLRLHPSKNIGCQGFGGCLWPK